MKQPPYSWQIAPWSTVRLEGDSVTVIPLDTLAAFATALSCPPLAASVTMGMSATTSTRNNARSGRPAPCNGPVRCGDAARFGRGGPWRLFSGDDVQATGKVRAGGDHHSEGGPRGRCYRLVTLTVTTAPLQASWFSVVLSLNFRMPLPTEVPVEFAATGGVGGDSSDLKPGRKTGRHISGDVGAEAPPPRYWRLSRCLPSRPHSPGCPERVRRRM